MICLNADIESNEAISKINSTRVELFHVITILVLNVFSISCLGVSGDDVLSRRCYLRESDWAVTVDQLPGVHKAGQLTRHDRGVLETEK